MPVAVQDPVGEKHALALDADIADHEHRIARANRFAVAHQHTRRGGEACMRGCLCCGFRKFCLWNSGNSGRFG